VSEKLTDSRRVALREKGVFPRSSDFNVLFATLGGFIGYKFVELDFSRMLDPMQVGLSSLFIPLGAAVGSMLATLIQSRFLFRFSLKKEKHQLSFTNSFYSLVKLFLSLVFAGIVCRKLLADAPTGLLKIDSFLQTTFLGVASFLMLFGLIGLLVSKFSFVIKYQMSRAEIESDAREGEMRPEIRAAMDSSFVSGKEQE